MEDGILKTAFRGYNKMQTLVYVDSLNALIMAAEEGSLPAQDAYQSARNIMNQPIAKAFSGFSIPDTDAYLNNLVVRLRLLAEQSEMRE